MQQIHTVGNPSICIAHLKQVKSLLGPLFKRFALGSDRHLPKADTRALIAHAHALLDWKGSPLEQQHRDFRALMILESVLRQNEANDAGRRIVSTIAANVRAQLGKDVDVQQRFMWRADLYTAKKLI